MRASQRGSLSAAAIRRSLSFLASTAHHLHSGTASKQIDSQKIQEMTVAVFAIVYEVAAKDVTGDTVLPLAPDATQGPEASASSHSAKVCGRRSGTAICELCNGRAVRAASTLSIQSHPCCIWVNPLSEDGPMPVVSMPGIAEDAA
jgi:hypothetical protein